MTGYCKYGDQCRCVSEPSMCPAWVDNVLPRVHSPTDLEGLLGNAVDAWHTAHPDLTVREILAALESIRYKVTEGLIALEDKP